MEGLHTGCKIKIVLGLSCNRVRIMQELGKQNPELLTLINQHQQEFLRIINEPVPPEQAEQVSQQIAQFQAGMGGGAGGEQGEWNFRVHADVPKRLSCSTAYNSQATHSVFERSAQSVGLCCKVTLRILPSSALWLFQKSLLQRGCVCAGLPPGAVPVHLTEEEQAAIGRLEGLGFDRNRCIEAFLLCERDETLAANFLFDSAMEEQ